jgi:hypothetical protein
MPKTESSNRIVVIGRPAPTTRKGASAKPTNQQQLTPQRTVVNRDGQFVGSK